MSNSACALDFVITKEHQRFAEFCEACRRFSYIGVCYGPPGVGKTLSARHYANWELIEACSSYSFASDTELAAFVGSQTIFYTPKVVNSPRQIEQAIQLWRNRLRAIPLEVIRREKEAALEVARQQDMASEQEFFLQTIETLYAPPSERPAKPASQVFHVAKTYAQKYEEAPEPTTLLMIDEADRLKTAGLVRFSLDHTGSCR
jgi:Cdc6-like AAA superfamily ATPase